MVLHHVFSQLALFVLLWLFILLHLTWSRPVERGDPSAEFNGETHRGQQVTPALTLPQVRYGLSMLLLAVYCALGIDSSCRQGQRQLQRNESARFYHHRTRKCMPPRKLRRDIQ